MKARVKATGEIWEFSQIDEITFKSAINGHLYCAEELEFLEPMETKFNFKTILQVWEDYRSWFIFTEDGLASCRMCICDDSPKEAVISDLYTLEVCRQQGYATGLLRFCEIFAVFQGCNSVSLRSDNDDWVRQWYKRIGFEVESSQVWLKKEI